MRGMQVKVRYIVLFVISIVVFATYMLLVSVPQEIYKVITVRDLVRLFPHKVSQIDAQLKGYLRAAKKQLRRILEIPDEERTFANTVKAYDNIMNLSDLAIFAVVMQMIELLSPVEALRNSAHEATLKIDEWAVDVASNRELYQAFKIYVEQCATKESLSEEQNYYLEKRMKQFKRDGLELSDEQLQQFKVLKKELNELMLDFEKNIATDNRTIEVTRDDLQGLSEDFINALRQSNAGAYILGMDYPTYFTVMERCSVTQTRRQLYELFNNKAYPANEKLLQQMIAKRDQLAKLLGFASYAHYNLDDQMVQSPERAHQFLHGLLERADQKLHKEFEELFAHLPDTVKLNKDGQIDPWDYSFALNKLKQTKYDVDEEKISEYFPVEDTIAGLLSIYESFLSLRFEEDAVHGLWSNDIRLLKVFPKCSDQLIGYLLLDLYPRANKYGHAAHQTIVPATFDKNGGSNIEVSVIIANFPKAAGDKPSLFKRSDVKTFFHEFGHAMHALIGRTRMAGLAGTAVKTDFVEMPSQMLEEWLWDKEILKLVSCHYQTKESLPDELIDAILASRHISTGFFVARQVMSSLQALQYFLEGEVKDLNQIQKELHESTVTYVAYDTTNHSFASFGHLTGYAAKYYGYLWARVFALDLFHKIKKEGLLNPVVGQKYIDNVIGRGGSQDPNTLLYNFLGRAPNDQAFFKDMGL